MPDQFNFKPWESPLIFFCPLSTTRKERYKIVTTKYALFHVHRVHNAEVLLGKNLAPWSDSYPKNKK